MAIRSSSLPTTHYPNTYMEQFCNTLHPNFELGTICVSWFRQATKHCTELITNIKEPPSYFWTTVKNFIFPDKHTDLVSQKIPIHIHPNQLSIQDCQSLFLDIVKDYIERAPRYAAESITNVKLWQVLYSLMGIMALGSLLLGTILTYNKYGKPKQKIGHLDDISKREKCLQAVARRSLRLAKTEVQKLHVQPIIQREELLAPDGTAILVMKVESKLELLESIVSCKLQTAGRLYRLHDQNKPKSEFKLENLTKAMKFLDNNSKKLRVLLMFDDGPVCEEVETKQRKSNTKSPQSKSSHSPLTRSSTLSNKRMLNPELGGSTSYDVSTKRSIIPTAFKSGSNSPRSPRSDSHKQANTPRSGNPPTSGIPRNPKQSPKKIMKKIT